MPRPYEFGFSIRPILRLNYVEKILRATRVVVPIPSRPTLIGWLEEGVWEGKKLDYGWVVYEDSFHEWVRRMQA
ncbi:MAG: hypothetical protein ABIP75_13470 [Pyrinomonadaceae bacterium]